MAELDEYEYTATPEKSSDFTGNLNRAFPKSNLETTFTGTNLASSFPETNLERTFSEEKHGLSGVLSGGAHKLKEAEEGIIEAIRKRRAERVASDEERRSQGLPTKNEEIMNELKKLAGSARSVISMPMPGFSQMSQTATGTLDYASVEGMGIVKIGDDFLITAPKNKDVFLISLGKGFTATSIKKLDQIV